MPIYPIRFFPCLFLCRLQKKSSLQDFPPCSFSFFAFCPTAFLCFFCCCDYCVIPWQDFDMLTVLTVCPGHLRCPRISEHYCRDSLGALPLESKIRFLIEVSQHWGRLHHYQKIPILIIQRDLSHKLSWFVFKILAYLDLKVSDIDFSLSLFNKGDLRIIPRIS